jgi:alpha-1,3-mannosyltransferase
VEVVTLDRDLQSGRPLTSPPQIDSIPTHRVGYFGSRRYPVAPSWIKFARDFDLIHIHAIDFFIDSAALATFLRLNRKPIIVTTHGGIYHTTAWRPLKNLYWRFVLRRTLIAAAKVVAVSEKDASLFASIVAREKLVTIPNGIDPIFQETKTSRVRGRVVCIGRVSAAKAIDRVIQLIARLEREFGEFELIIAGPDERGTADALRREAVGLGIGDRVRIVGELPPGELATLVASAHLFVSAAQHEGFGITTVEALSAGVPVLVTRTGVHEQIVRHGVNGWFWSGRADEEANAVLRAALLLPDARLDEMQGAARASAEGFGWNTTTELYEHVFESVHRQSAG